MSKFIEYLNGVQSEMKKVSWPSKDEVKDATILVVVFSIFFAIVVKLFDLGLDKILGLVLNL